MQAGVYLEKFGTKFDIVFSHEGKAEVGLYS